MFNSTTGDKLAEQFPAAQRGEEMPAGFNLQRCLDLLRFCRAELHEAELITDQEYADLACIGAQSARRLEGYDDLRQKLFVLAKLAKSYEEPQFFNPLDAMAAKQLRDEVLAEAALAAEGGGV